MHKSVFYRATLSVALFFFFSNTLAQQSRFSLDIGLIGMRVTPVLQDNFVQNDWLWVDPTSGDEYFGFSANEPRGIRFKLHYRITKRFSFQVGEDFFNRTYYVNGFYDPDENGNIAKARVVGFLDMDDKSRGFKLLSASTQFGFDWNFELKKNTFQIYTSLNYDFYEFNQARRDLPIRYESPGPLDESTNYTTVAQINVTTLNTTERGITNNFWSLNTGVAYSRHLKDNLSFKVDFGFRNTALWKNFGFDKNAVELDLTHSRYAVDDEFEEDPIYQINRKYDFPLYLGGFYAGFGLSMDLFRVRQIDSSASPVNKVLTHLIQIKADEE